MKPKYEMIFGIHIVDTGYRGLKRRLGKVEGVKEPGYVLGIPLIHDIADVQITPKKIDQKRQVTTQDNRGIDLETSLFVTINDPELFMDRAPDDYLNQVLPKFLQEIEARIPREYSLGALKTGYVDLSHVVETSLNEEVRNWGIEVAVSITQPYVPPISPRGVEERDLRITNELPLQIREAEMRGTLAVVQAEIQKAVRMKSADAAAYAQLQQLTAQAEGLRTFAQVYDQFGSTIMKVAEGLQGKMDSSDMVYLLSTMVRDIFKQTDYSPDQQDRLAEGIENKIRAKYEGQGLSSRAKAAGISPQLGVLTETLKNMQGTVIPILNIGSRATPEEIDNILTGTYRPNAGN